MLRVVLKVLRFLVKQIKGFTTEAELEQEVERLRETKQVVYEAW